MGIYCFIEILEVLKNQFSLLMVITSKISMNRQANTKFSSQTYGTMIRMATMIFSFQRELLPTVKEKVVLNFTEMMAQMICLNGKENLKLLKIPLWREVSQIRIEHWGPSKLVKLLQARQMLFGHINIQLLLL